LRLIDYDPELFLERTAIGYLIAPQLRPSQNDTEGVIEIVGYARSESPDRVKLLQPPNFVFQTSSFSPLRNLLDLPLNR